MAAPRQRTPSEQQYSDPLADRVFAQQMSRKAQASISELSRELGINPKTVAKWRKRQTVEDQTPGPKEPRSTVLSEDEEAMVVAFRRHTLLPLDDCLYALQPSIPHLTRSSLHRCLQRHGMSRLPDVEGVFDPAIAQVVHHREPEFGSIIGGDPQPQNLDRPANLRRTQRR